MSAPPAAAAAAVLVKSADLSGEPTVSGYDFNNGVDHDALLASMISTGARRARCARVLRRRRLRLRLRRRRARARPRWRR